MEVSMGAESNLYKIPEQLHRATVTSVSLSSILLLVSICRGKIEKIPFLDVAENSQTPHLPGEFVIFFSFVFALFGILALIFSYLNEGRPAISVSKSSVNLDVIGSANVDSIIEGLKKFLLSTDVRSTLKEVKSLKYSNPELVIDKLKCQKYLMERIERFNFSEFTDEFYKSLPENVRMDQAIAGYLPSALHHFSNKIDGHIDSLIGAIDTISEDFLITPEKMYNAIQSINENSKNLAKQSKALRSEIRSYRSSLTRDYRWRNFQVWGINIIPSTILFCVASSQAFIAYFDIDARMLPQFFG